MTLPPTGVPMLLRKYEMPWRRAYEAYAGLAWTLASVFFIFAMVRAAAPWPLSAGLALLCVMRRTGAWRIDGPRIALW